MPAWRLEKVNRELLREVSRIVLQELSDPGIGFVTFTRAEVTPDLRTAKVFFSVLGDEHRVEVITRGLERARGFVQNLIGKRMKMRHTPEISFTLDKSIAASIRVSRLIDQEIGKLESAENQESKDTEPQPPVRRSPERGPANAGPSRRGEGGNDE